MKVIKGKDGSGQKNMTHGWIWMSSYWLCCILVGYQREYLTFDAMFRIPEQVSSSSVSSSSDNNNLVFWIIIATITTILAQDVMGSRNDTFDRKRNLPAILVFGIMNGILETLLFFASYDYGRDMGGWMGLSTASSAIVGFFTFFIYSFLIHALFWLPIAFPPHGRINAPPFHIHGLPALTALGVAWIGLYELTGGTLIIIPCLLHVYVDIGCGLTMNLPGPFDKEKEDHQQTHYHRVPHQQQPDIGLRHHT